MSTDLQADYLCFSQMWHVLCVSRAKHATFDFYRPLDKKKT